MPYRLSYLLRRKLARARASRGKTSKEKERGKMLNRVYDVIRPGDNGSRARLVRARAPRFAAGGKAWWRRHGAVATRPAPTPSRRCDTRVASRVTPGVASRVTPGVMSRVTPGVATGLHSYNYGID